METRLRRGDATLAVGLADDAAVVDGTSRALADVTAAQPAATHGWTVDVLAFLLDGRPVRAVVARRGDRVQVCVDGRVLVFDVGDDARGGAGAHGGSGRVTAPMPGKVTRVAVAVGDVVEAGAAVVVLEAMKMETSLAADAAGVVAAVHVAPGALVEAGAVLVEIAPPR
jgi:3-methylcrotonyl-CoA carboxylase alpha subunit